MTPIVVEEILGALFALIPEMQYIDDLSGNVRRKPEYHFGNAKECNSFLKAMKSDVFPLIYQTSTEEEQDYSAKKVSTSLELILATRTSATLLNDQRWATSYKNILMPLLDYVVTTFHKSRVISWDGVYTVDKFPNYGATETQEQNAFIEIVDAIRVRLTIRIDGNTCVDKKIIY